MAIDPTKPADHSPVVAAELRNQLNALQAQITALQNAVNGLARKPQVGEFDPGLHDPPTTEDLQAVQNYLNQLVQQM